MILQGLTCMPRQSVRLMKNGSYIIQAVTITSKSTRGSSIELKEPFPYEKKKFRWHHSYTDPTVVRLSHENAKLIVVEGPIGVGKSAVCMALAEEFEMKYFPQPTMDDLYTFPSGYDIRQHDEEVPEIIRTYDHRNFCVDPFSKKAGILQLQLHDLRYFQYIDALCHLLNTGQGVILERSMYSDFVFMLAMTENKYVSKEVKDAYFTIMRNVSNLFPKPHLVLYLDISVPVVQERIKTRNYSYEQNSPALTNCYLQCLENFWKKAYLNEARDNSEVLIYDWSDGGNIDVVIDDIESLNFDIMRKDKRFTSWWLSRKNLHKLRYKCTNSPHYHFSDFLYYPWYMVDDVFEFYSKSEQWYYIFNKIPECWYDVGFNPLVGDSKLKILFKMSSGNDRSSKHHLVKKYIFK